MHFDPCCLGVFSLSCMSYSSPVVVFLDHEHPGFWNFYSTIPANFIGAKFYVNRLFDTVCVPMRIMINKFYFVLKWVVSCDVSF